MNKAIIFILCLAAGSVCAQDASDATAKDDAVDLRVDVFEVVAVAAMDDDPVDLRVDVFEVIDVTAEKAPVALAEETDADIDAILEEAEAIESE